MALCKELCVLQARITSFVWFFLCVGISVDTHLFVYLSLSQTLVGGTMILLLGLCAILSLLQSKCSSLFVSRIQWLLLAWMLYLLGHALFVRDAETYKLLYWLEFLSLLFILPSLVYCQQLSRRSIENGILLMAGSQIVSLCLQAVGIMASYNDLFSLTGFSENPNVPAILLSVCLPLSYDRMKASTHKIVYGMFLLLSFIFLIVLNCRTSYIGLGILIIVRFLATETTRRFWRKRSAWGKSMLVLSFFVLLAVASVGLYRSKQASADGRLLVWKVSAMMLRDNPMGIGIGMFEHDYNLTQGEYLSSDAATKAERYNSSTVYMAYNDFLEQGVESGWISMLFLLAVYGSFAYRIGLQDVKTLSVILAFAAMSCTNFIAASIQPWMVLMCYGSLVLSETSHTRQIPAKAIHLKTTFPLYAIPLCLLILFHSHLLYAQFQLNRFQIQSEKGIAIDIQRAESLSSYIGTSEAYYRFIARQYQQQGDYNRALQNWLVAKQYTSTPDIFFSIFDCYNRMGKGDAGIPYIIEVSRMLPQNLTSRLILLKWYDSLGNLPVALSIAQEISDIHIKIRNQRSKNIQRYARIYIQQHQSDKLIAQ